MKRNLGHDGDGHQGTKQVYIVKTQFFQIITSRSITNILDYLLSPRNQVSTGISKKKSLVAFLTVLKVCKVLGFAALNTS